MIQLDAAVEIKSNEPHWKMFRRWSQQNSAIRLSEKKLRVSPRFLDWAAVFE